MPAKLNMFDIDFVWNNFSFCRNFSITFMNVTVILVRVKWETSVYYSRWGIDSAICWLKVFLTQYSRYLLVKSFSIYRHLHVYSTDSNRRQYRIIRLLILRSLELWMFDLFEIIQTHWNVLRKIQTRWNFPIEIFLPPNFVRLVIFLFIIFAQNTSNTDFSFKNKSTRQNPKEKRHMHTTLHFNSQKNNIKFKRTN